MEMAGAVARKATIMELAACRAKIANLKSFKIARLDGEPAVRAKDRAIIATPTQLCCTKSSETLSSNKIEIDFNGFATCKHAAPALTSFMSSSGSRS